MSLPQNNPAVTTVSPNRGLISTVLIAAGIFTVFLVIYLVARQKPAPVGDNTEVTEENRWKFTQDGRQARLNELRGKEQTLATSYGWVDREAGVVRIPVDRAVEITIRELNGQRK